MLVGSCSLKVAIILQTPIYLHTIIKRYWFAGSVHFHFVFYKLPYTSGKERVPSAFLIIINNEFLFMLKEKKFDISFSNLLSPPYL